MMHIKTTVLLIILNSLFCSLIAEEGIFAVISPSVTFDNRPMLWKNRNGDSTNTTLYAFQGGKYDFIGLIKNNDTTVVLAGQNTAGFTLAFNTALDASPQNPASIAVLIKTALGQCGSIHEFSEMLNNSKSDGAIFGCFDNRGNCGVFEVSTAKTSYFNVNDTQTAPNGFLIRQQFSMSANNTELGPNTWPYHRARELLAKQSRSKKLDSQYILQTVARDVMSDDLNPYPLPFKSRYHQAPRQFVKTENTINNSRTTNCFLFFGPSKTRSNNRSGFLYIPGNPICGIAVPIWPQSGEVPGPLKSIGFMSLAAATKSIHQKIYRKSKWPQYFDSKLLAKGENSVLNKNLKFEKQIINEINSLQINTNSELIKVQNKWAQQALRVLK